MAELKHQGQWDAVKILHHRTRRMKINKVLFSLSDSTTAREVALKLWTRATGRKRIATVRES
jgi:hypothetical protein